MPIFRAPDSLARSEVNPYSASFVHSTHHTAKKAISTPSSDTIEFSKRRVEQEALKTLRHTKQFLIAIPGFVRIGKYLFAGLSFPPYLLLYKLPKLLLISGHHVFTLVLAPPIQRMMAWSKKKTEQLSAKVTRGLARARQYSLRLLQPLVSSLKTVSHAFARSAKNFLMRLSSPLSKLARTSQKIRGSLAHASRRGVQNIGAFWNRPLILPLKTALKHVQSRGAQAIKTVESLRNGIHEAVSHAAQRLQEWTNLAQMWTVQSALFLTLPAQRGKALASRFFKQLRARTATLQAACGAPFRGIKTQWQSLKGTFQRAFQKWHALLLRARKRSIDQKSQALWDHLATQARNSTNFLKKVLTLTWLWLQRYVLLPLKRGAITLVLGLLHAAQRVHHALHFMIGAIRRSTKDALHALRSTVAAVLHFLWRGCCVSLYWCTVIVMMGILLIKGAFTLLFEGTQRHSGTRVSKHTVT